MKSRSAWPSWGVTRPWASMRRDCVTRLISSRMWAISFGGTTASWGYGPGGGGSQDAAGLRHAVDLIADVGHLLRRHHRFLGIWPGRGRDEPDRRLAIEEHPLHKVLPREVGHGAAVGRELRVQPLGPLAQPQQSLLRDGTLATGL